MNSMINICMSHLLESFVSEIGQLCEEFEADQLPRAGALSVGLTACFNSRQQLSPPPDCEPIHVSPL